MGHLKIFGAIAYSHISPKLRKKLDPHSIKCIMVGYCESEGIKGYNLFNPQNRKFIYSRSVIFYEQILSAKYPINLQNIPLINYVNNHEYGKEHVNNMRESLEL